MFTLRVWRMVYRFRCYLSLQLRFHSASRKVSAHTRPPGHSDTKGSKCSNADGLRWRRKTDSDVICVVKSGFHSHRVASAHTRPLGHSIAASNVLTLMFEMEKV
ncbi:hypothetical protein AVEN_200740-1 [Araneus ventricosus]|uniref:Uncharacterized protein n=1 Tax=Araneus ventricosus TaxID=182803 RepID=A0A4Y2NZL4_ARAVE|nr:hypothetical protein AVEN_200740-1 [Araneus ventricosus]